MSVTTSVITPRNAVAIHTQNNPTAKPSKAEIRSHQRDLAYSILMSIGDTLYDNSLKNESLHMVNPRVNNIAAIHQVFDLASILTRVEQATRELEVLREDQKINKSVLVSFFEKMEKLLSDLDLYSDLYKFHSIKDPLFYVEGIQDLKDSKLVQSAIIRRVAEAKERNPSFFPEKTKSNPCCVIQ